MYNLYVHLCTSPPSPLRVSLQMGRVGPLDRWPDPQNSAPEGLWVDPYNFRVKRVQEPVHPGSTRNRLITALRRGDALLSWIEAAAAASGWGDASRLERRRRLRVRGDAVPGSGPAGSRRFSSDDAGDHQDYEHGEPNGATSATREGRANHQCVTEKRLQRRQEEDSEDARDEGICPDFIHGWAGLWGHVIDASRFLVARIGVSTLCQGPLHRHDAVTAARDETRRGSVGWAVDSAEIDEDDATTQKLATFGSYVPVADGTAGVHNAYNWHSTLGSPSQDSTPRRMFPLPSEEHGA
uniref:Uncharacterized protein n=1 Tax=Oryza glumipatula TaxID=40148 RepID=A0A0D9Z4H0_9ORYZ